MLAVLHGLLDALRAVAWVLIWPVYAIYVAASVVFALVIVGGIVATILAAIPDRKQPAAEGRDARP